MRSAIEAYFDRDAGKLARLYKRSGWFSRLVDRRLRGILLTYVDLTLSALSDVERPFSLLDMGCGTAAAGIAAARTGAEVTCLDLSSVMLARAREAVGEAGVGSLCFVQGDALTWGDGERFDVVVAIGLADYVAPAALFARMAALTRRYIIITVGHPGTWWTAFRRLRYGLRRIRLNYVDRRDIEPMLAAAGLKLVGLQAFHGREGASFIFAEKNGSPPVPSRG